MCQLRIHALVLRKFGFQFLHLLELRRLQAAIYRLPLVIRRRADAMLAAHLIVMLYP